MRFGDANQPEQLGRRQALRLHVAKALDGIPFARRIAVLSYPVHDYQSLGCNLVINEHPEQGLSRLSRMAVEECRQSWIEAVLTLLADMSRATVAHVAGLLALEYGSQTIVSSSDGRHFQPPVLFGAAQFSALRQLEGDLGARNLIGVGKHLVVADPDELIDIDSRDQLQSLRAKFGE